MNLPTKFFFVSFFFLFHLQIAGAADEFDIEQCTADSVYFQTVKMKNVKNLNGHRYYIFGTCGQDRFSLGAYYWIEVKSYREVVRHQSLGLSYWVGRCDMSPILFDVDCLWGWPSGPQGSVHVSYGSSIARSILSEAQLAALDARLEAARQRSLGTKQLSGEVKVPKDVAMQ